MAAISPVLRTATTSVVRLGDIEAPGYTWPAFSDHWIGSIAWVHAPARITATVLATLATRVTPTAGAATPLAPAVGASAPVTAATHALFDNTDGPADVVHSFYNAINRREYDRAYNYLSFLPGDVQDRPAFVDGYATTRAVTLTTLLRASYTNGAGSNATTCVAFALTSRETTGAVKRYGGWYMAHSTSTPGQVASAGGWRIVMDGSHSTEGGRATIPPRSRCVVPARGHTTGVTAPPPSRSGH